MNYKLGSVLIVALIVIIILVIWTMRDYQNDLLQKFLSGNWSKPTIDSASQIITDQNTTDANQSSANNDKKPEPPAPEKKLTEAPQPKTEKSQEPSNPKVTETTTIIRDPNRITGEPLPANWPNFVPPIGGSRVTSVLAKDDQNYMLSAEVYKNPQAVLKWYQIKLLQSGFTITSSTQNSLQARNDKYEVLVELEPGSVTEVSCNYAITVYPAIPVNLPPGIIK